MSKIEIIALIITNVILRLQNSSEGSPSEIEYGMVSVKVDKVRKGLINATD